MVAGMTTETPDATRHDDSARTARGTATFVRNAARRRVLRNLADWSTMPEDTFDDPEIAGKVVTYAADIARRAGITLIAARGETAGQQ